MLNYQRVSGSTPPPNNHQSSLLAIISSEICGEKKTVSLIHGSLNVPIEHHPTIGYMVYNGYYKVMSNIPKMGHLPIPVISRFLGPYDLVVVSWKGSIQPIPKIPLEIIQESQELWNYQTNDQPQGFTMISFLLTRYPMNISGLGPPNAYLPSWRVHSSRPCALTLQLVGRNSQLW